MGVLLIVAGGLGWVTALVMILTGSPRPALWLSAVVGLLGLVATIAPFVLDRRLFGELGHGDGMGLIGLTMVGALLAFSGLVLMLAAAAKGADKNVNGAKN